MEIALFLQKHFGKILLKKAEEGVLVTGLSGLSYDEPSQRLHLIIGATSSFIELSQERLEEYMNNPRKQFWRLLKDLDEGLSTTAPRVVIEEDDFLVETEEECFLVDLPEEDMTVTYTDGITIITNTEGDEIIFDSEDAGGEVCITYQELTSGIQFEAPNWLASFSSDSTLSKL